MAEAAKANPETKAVQPPPLRISRLLHARRETVFKAWTMAEHIKQWFSPAGCSVPEATVDARVGGTFNYCMRIPGGAEHWSRGKFVEVTPTTRLVIDMLVASGAGDDLFRALTEIDLFDDLGGTRMEIVQTYTLLNPGVAAAMIGGAQEGWRTTLDKLEKTVVALQGGAETAVRSVVHATFHLERTYDSPVGRVWKALTDESAKQKWFGGPPGRFVTLERHMDVRVGGTERMKGRWEGGTVSTFDAIYHDVIPHERLVYSYVMHLDDKKISASLATMQLKTDGAKTTLSVTEQGAFLDGYDDAGSREEGTRLLLEAIGASLED
jgi:uncharacterized protein YndB with AHSA1/START domain